jgi:hypothetical protein
MPLDNPKLLVRMSRLRVQFGIDQDANDYCYEVALLGEDGSPVGMKKMLFPPDEAYLLASELDVCAAAIKAHIAAGA